MKNRGGVYDLWSIDSTGNSGKKTPQRTHPSLKRRSKNSFPHPGQSYNPDPQEHKKLLNKVAKLEMAEQKKRDGINKALRIKVSQTQLELAERVELLSGIEHLVDNKINLSHPVSKNKDKKKPAKKTNDVKVQARFPNAATPTKEPHENKQTEASSSDDDFSDYDVRDFDAMLVDRTVVEKRKTPQQRARELKDKQQRKAAKVKKSNNITRSKFDGLKKLVKKLDLQKKLAELNKKRRKKDKHQRFKEKLELSDPVYQLSSQLPKNLRELNCPMNTVVQQQLETFQKRLMVEPTCIQTSFRRYKKKKYEKLSNKDDYEDSNFDKMDIGEKKKHENKKNKDKIVWM